MLDYQLSIQDSNSPDYNLNRFMQFCGVQYQLVEWDTYCFLFLFETDCNEYAQVRGR